MFPKDFIILNGRERKTVRDVNPDFESDEIEYSPYCIGDFLFPAMRVLRYSHLRIPRVKNERRSCDENRRI